MAGTRPPTINAVFFLIIFLLQIVVGGLLLPWVGYLFGYLVAFVLRQSPADCLTIAIETGIQNTGIAIFLLRFALPQPQADLTTGALHSDEYVCI